MFEHKSREIRIALLLALGLLRPAHAAGPRLGPNPGFKLNGESSLTSPDGQIRLEQSPATKKPLGDLAWDYFFTTAASKGMVDRSLALRPRLEDRGILGTRGVRRL